MTVSAGHIAKAEAYKKLCMQQPKKRACIFIRLPSCKMLGLSHKLMG